MKIEPSVVMRFNRIGPETKANLDGFALDYRCGGDNCKTRPTLLVTANNAQQAFCDDHTGQGVANLFEAAATGDQRYGFLVRPKPRKGPIVKNAPKLSFDDTNVIWENTLDKKRFRATVYTSKEDARWGILIVREGDKLLRSESVPLAYQAMFGPDVADVSQWEERAIDIIDSGKSARKRLDEALKRAVATDRSSVRLLREAPFAEDVFLEALKTFNDPDMAVDWLRSRCGALNFKAPVSLLGDKEGAKSAKRLLAEILSDVYPLSGSSNAPKVS